MVTIDDSVMRHQAWLGQLLNDDRNSAVSTCDLVLESEGKQFRVHKSVVMLVSNFFRSMFTVEMREKYEGIVKMQQIPHQRLANIIQFVYSGKIEITEENMLDVLDDAEFTDIEVLKAKCSDFLLEVLSADNCLKLRTYAKRYNLDNLIEKSNQTIAENFEAVVQHEDFKQLDADDMSVILEQKNKDCEEVVFTGIVQWVNHNPIQREEMFVNLFSQLDLSSMSVDFLDEVYKEKLVKNNMVCLNLFAQASLKINKRLTGKNTTNQFLLVGGKDTEQDCVVYDVISKQAQQLPKLQEPRCGASSVKVGSKVYVIGGAKNTNGDNPYNSCELLDLNEKMGWVAMPVMLEARDDCRSEFLQDYIYVTGGFNGQALSCCEKFDIHNNKWSRVKNMLKKRYSHGTVVCNNSLYCVGGCDGYNHMTSCEHYDVRTGIWNEVAPLNQPRKDLACVVLDREIYAIGGRDDDILPTVEKYEPKVNKWKLVASLIVARSGFSACVVGNKIFVIGGFDGKNNLKSVEVYDPTSDVWTNAFEIEKPVDGATVVAL